MGGQYTGSPKEFVRLGLWWEMGSEGRKMQAIPREDHRRKEDHSRTGGWRSGSGRWNGKLGLPIGMEVPERKRIKRNGILEKRPCEGSLRSQAPGPPQLFPLWQQMVPPSYLPGGVNAHAAEGVDAKAAKGDQQSHQHYSSGRRGE